MQRIVILISGQGSNMEALAKACVAEHWPAQVVAVISNRPAAAGLQVAHSLGLATRVIDHTGFAERADFDAALAEAIDTLAPDWVVLAGFMRVLGPAFVQRYEGRLINIHPSLLPAFPGLHTHRRALQAGCAVAGATVHFVTPELDHGPIVAQAVVPVWPGDTETTLAARVLKAEHGLYATSLRWLVQGKARLREGRVEHVEGEPRGWWAHTAEVAL
jgi:phosphoribosylglycinamide formyltransferase 1